MYTEISTLEYVESKGVLTVLKRCWIFFHCDFVCCAMARRLSVREDTHYVVKYLCYCNIQIRSHVFFKTDSPILLARSTTFSGGARKMSIVPFCIPDLRPTCDLRKRNWKNQPHKVLLCLLGPHPHRPSPLPHRHCQNQNGGR